MGQTKPAQKRLFSRQEVGQRILNGEHLFVLDGKLIKAPPSWLDAHPGGALAILHFVGRDATDEVLAYHAEKALRRVYAYAIGEVEGYENGWSPFVPPVMSGWVRRVENGNAHWHNEAAAEKSSEDTHLSPSSQILLVHKDSPVLDAAPAPTVADLAPPPTGLSLKVQTEHAKAYRTLHDRIKEAGLYQTRYLTGYGPEIARYLLLGISSWWTYKHDWLFVSALCLGALWHQLVFTVHDLGHMGVTHDWTIDRFIGIFVASWVGGLSIGWWVDNHNTHHLVTNHPSHDPDIQHLPFIAISPVFFKSLWSSYYKTPLIFDRFAQVFIRVQHQLFYLVMSLARFNLYALAYTYLFKRAISGKTLEKSARWVAPMEWTGIVFFWCWYGAVLYGCGSWRKAIMYLLISNVTASPLHVQIVLSHFSMSTADLGPTESFAARQLRTTTDVACPDYLSFFHGGLHLQVTHHLFPRLPRHNLREASLLVKDFAREQGLVYAEFGGFVEGNGEIVDVLRNVAEQLKTIGTVARGEKEEAIANKLKSS